MAPVTVTMDRMPTGLLKRTSAMIAPFASLAGAPASNNPLR